jgi:hypothetical protein
MMVAILVVAITIVLFIIPADREQRSSAELTKLGAKLTTADNRPGWVKSLLKDVPITKVTSVDLAGTELTDAELKYLQEFPKLGGLILDRSKIHQFRNAPHRPACKSGSIEHGPHRSHGLSTR